MTHITRILLAAVFLTTSLTGTCLAAWEADYRDAWARKHGGETEVRLADGTRADIVTDSHAIEVDWAKKWPEAVGQSLWYSFQTNKKPGIILILKSEKDQRYLTRLRSLIEHKKLGIQVWTIRPQDLPEDLKKRHEPAAPIPAMKR